jgi:CubicO group peptidase (beta-lactamase class C family)
MIRPDSPRISTAPTRRFPRLALSLALALAVPHSGFAANAAAAMPAVAPAVADAAAPAIKPVSKPALDALRKAGRASDSSALLVWHDGQLLLSDYDAEGAQLISLQSITKTVVSLAIGNLIGEGRIASVDDPVSRYIPEFSGQGREKITLRHVLGHTTGLDTGDNAGLDVENAYSQLGGALMAPLGKSPPGLRFAYDNRGWQLLCGVVRSTSGEDVQDYLQRTVFARIGVQGYRWTRDSAGDSMCHAELYLHPRDLLLIGRLVLDRGRFADRQVVPQAWFDTALPREPDSEMHLHGVGLWWNFFTDPKRTHLRMDADGLNAMRAFGLSEDMAARLRALDGVEEDVLWTRYTALPAERQAEVRDARIAAVIAGAIAGSPLRVRGKLRSAVTTGGGGQYLYVDFDRRLIVVRMIAPHKIQPAQSGRDTDMRKLLPLIEAL